MHRTTNLAKYKLILGKNDFTPVNRNNYHLMFRGTAVSFYVDTKRYFAT